MIQNSYDAKSNNTKHVAIRRYTFYSRKIELLVAFTLPNRKWGWISWSVKLTYIQFKAKATSISQRIDIRQQRWQTKNSLKCELNRTVKTRTCSDRRTKPLNIPWLRRYQRTVSNLINLEISHEHHCSLGWVVILLCNNYSFFTICITIKMFEGLTLLQS